MKYIENAACQSSHLSIRTGFEKYHSVFVTSSTYWNPFGIAFYPFIKIGEKGGAILSHLSLFNRNSYIVRYFFLKIREFAVVNVTGHIFRPEFDFLFHSSSTKTDFKFRTHINYRKYLFFTVSVTSMYAHLYTQQWCSFHLDKNLR